jgi:hypothetical protein
MFTENHKAIIIRFVKVLIGKGKQINTEYIANSVRTMFPEYRDKVNLEQEIAVLCFDHLSPAPVKVKYVN